MSTSQFAATSFSEVASQLSLSSETSYDSMERSTKSYPLTSFPSYSWDVQDLENDQLSDDDGFSSCSTPTTPGLTWDSRPNSSEIVERDLKSAFEDWDAPSTDVSVVIEDDGSQTLLISSESPFFLPPPTPRPFDYEPFSKSFSNFQHDACSTTQKCPTDVGCEQLQSGKPIKKKKLFIDIKTFSPLGQTGFALGWVHHRPSLSVDVKTWATKNQPDVPLDCIYTADDVTPIERGDGNWSPVPLGPLRSSPCN